MVDVVCCLLVLVCSLLVVCCLLFCVLVVGVFGSLVFGVWRFGELVYVVRC